MIAAARMKEVEAEAASLPPTEASSRIESGIESVDLKTATGRRDCVFGAALVALIAKLAIAWNTFGTNDVLTFYLFGRTIAEEGLGAMYRTTILFNHPPLTAYYLSWIYELQRLPVLESLGVTFPFLLRLPGIVADFIVVSLLFDLGQRVPRFRVPTWALILFALSPVSLMVSGYHGNTDPVMVLFLVLAAYFCIRESAIFCGVFFALSVQVKIIPLLLVPFFFFFWLNRRALFHFLLPAMVVSTALWCQPLLQFPALFIKNVLSYSSFWGIWGISYLVRLTGWRQFAEVSFFDLTPSQNLVINLCKAVIILIVLSLAWRQRKQTGRTLWDTIAFAWLVFFVFAPGICTQYLVWLAPFILLLSPSFYAWVTAASSVFAFVFYDTISRGLPWFRGISTNAINKHWVPWSILPWIILILGCCWFWRRAFRAGLNQADLVLEESDSAG
jgi:Gpi18-like mannosyltransferase